jgi:hypothetical protein
MVYQYVCNTSIGEPDVKPSYYYYYYQYVCNTSIGEPDVKPSYYYYYYYQYVIPS